VLLDCWFICVWLVCTISFRSTISWLLTCVSPARATNSE
jgi:hypothetical protein